MFNIKSTINHLLGQDETPASPTQSLPTHWFVETVFGDRALALDCYEDKGQWIYILTHVEKWWGKYYASPNTFFVYEGEIIDVRDCAVEIVGV